MELCVMCGRVLPTESNSMVCRTCRLTANCDFIKFNCPECGKPLTVYSTEVVEHRPAKCDAWSYLEVDLIYHCNHCGCDWDSLYVSEWGDSSQTKPHRHYWG